MPDASAPLPLFFFGAMSPYSWFAAERIEWVLPEAEWRPVFAGGLFKAAGRSSWGLDDRRPSGLADCEARAAEHGLGPISWPEPWPTLDLLVARAMLYAARCELLKPFSLAAMRMAFREGADLGDLTVIEEAGTRVGLDRVELAGAVTSEEFKAPLREANDQARALGRGDREVASASGVPSSGRIRVVVGYTKRRGRRRHILEELLAGVLDAVCGV